MAVVDSEGIIYIWGSNEHGKLGYSNVNKQSSKHFDTHKHIKFEQYSTIKLEDKIKKVCCGKDHTLVLL